MRVTLGELSPDLSLVVKQARESVAILLFNGHLLIIEEETTPSAAIGKKDRHSTIGERIIMQQLEVLSYPPHQLQAECPTQKLSPL